MHNSVGVVPDVLLDLYIWVTPTKCQLGLQLEVLSRSRVYYNNDYNKTMNPNTTAIQYMGMIMRGDNLNIDYVLSMVEIINNSYLSAKDVVTVLE